MKQEQPWRGARPKKRSNGNPVYYEESKSFRSMVWDEENRLRGINDNGKLHLYTYDHTGERAVKSSGESSTVVTNGLTSAVITHMDDYTAYVNPYFVVQKGKFTKHYFEGSSRIVSKLGEGTFVHKNTGIMAGGIDYIRQNAQMQEARDNYIRGLKVPPGPPTQHGIYASPEWTGQPYPSLGWQNIRQDQEPPEGWPRPPKFNEPGDVPGPPVQYGDPITPQTVKAGYGFVDNGIREKNLYFYHPDHLGSSSYITDREGRITQHTEYIAFGELLFEEHSTSKTMPYLFNGKELDTETGLYYYGARYYDPKTSIFLNVDPLTEKTMTPYAYTNNNPINLIDPTGMASEDPPKGNLRFIINLGGASDASDAAKTRYNEIKKSYPKDKIVMLEVSDLGKLEKLVNQNVSESQREGYGKTVEVSFYGHGGTDGPVGAIATSQNSLSDITGNPEDRGQLSAEGWKQINWNFDPDRSIAAFYGCDTSDFAHKFLQYSNVKYSAGIDGKAGGSKTYKGNFNASWFGFGNVYMVSQTDGKVNPTDVYTRGKYFRNSHGMFIPKITPIYGNASVNERGQLTYGSIKINKKK